MKEFKANICSGNRESRTRGWFENIGSISVSDDKHYPEINIDKGYSCRYLGFPKEKSIDWKDVEYYREQDYPEIETESYIFFFEICNRGNTTIVQSRFAEPFKNHNFYFSEGYDKSLYIEKEVED